MIGVSGSLRVPYLLTKVELEVGNVLTSVNPPRLSDVYFSAETSGRVGRKKNFKVL